MANVTGRRASRRYAELYSNRHHLSAQQVINIERRVRRNTLYRQRQIKRLLNNNDFRLLAVLSRVHFNPRISIRQIERELRIPRSTVHRMLVSVQYHLYYINFVQELNESDCRLRVQFCRWALNALEQNLDFFRNVSDEAIFHSNDSLNRHNSHYWSPVNPHWYR